ncbi:integrase core domain-containing protein [Sphingomonas sp. AP4-R1]|uniref:integrase core domain-containing protein n=1 Tax=Sphingomonas sp. AP4-R1 TaxID=2735134 RepID=UPI003461F5E9
MAEVFVRTLKCDHVRLNHTPDARAVTEQPPAWLTPYNQVRPHKTLGYRSPREYIMQTLEAPSGILGATSHFPHQRYELVGAGDYRSGTIERCAPGQCEGGTVEASVIGSGYRQT